MLLAIPISNHENWKFRVPTVELAIPISNWKFQAPTIELAMPVCNHENWEFQAPFYFEILKSKKIQIDTRMTPNGPNMSPKFTWHPFQKKDSL